MMRGSRRETLTRGTFMAAFPSVTGAARWCLAVQLDLLRLSWPAALTVERGQTVTFVNRGKVTHNAKGKDFFSRVVEPEALPHEPEILPREASQIRQH